MKAPDSLKNIINEMLDKHWDDILRSNEFYEVTSDPSFNLCLIKLQFGTENTKEVVDRFVLRIITKWNTE